MPPEILALVDKPILLIAVLSVGAVFGVFAEQLMSELRPRSRPRKAWTRWPGRRGYSRTAPARAGEGDRPPSAAQSGWWRGQAPGTGAGRTPPDAADQLRIVMNADFTIQPLLNKGEARLFKELDRAVLARNPAWQVMAQVSLGEVLRSENAAAYGCINSKRVDLLLMDEHCQPRHAIEYQGGGHHQGTAAARDAVKKEALRRAGIGYHEVIAGQTTPAELRRLVEKLVNAP